MSGGRRGGLAMCGGGVVRQSAAVRSVHVARSPVPLSKLHSLPAPDVPRLGLGK